MKYKLLILILFASLSAKAEVTKLDSIFMELDTNDLTTKYFSKL
jgi:hypothetical protein